MRLLRPSPPVPPLLLLQVQADRAAALARAKQAGYIEDYSGWRR